MKIQTVNIVKAKDESLLSVTSFEESKDGNNEAENLFRTMISELEPEITEHDIQACMDNGYFEDANCSVYIIHSE